MRRVSIAGTVIVVSLAAGACGGSSKAASTSQTTFTAPSAPASDTTSVTAAKENFGQKYLAIINPLNASMTSALNTLQHVPANITGPEVEKELMPTIAALTTAQRKLLAVQWPGQANADAHTLSIDLGTLIGDFEAYGGATALDAGADTTTLGRDATTASSASAAVRSDLGLPSNLSS